MLARLSKLVLLAGLAAASLLALDPKSLQPQGYINDFANVVDAPTRADINRYCAAVERATGAQIAIVTLRSLEGAPIEDFANDLFRQWGVGQKGKDEGLLLLFAIDDRRSRLEVGRGLEAFITDGTSGSILREMRPALRAGDYGSAFRTAAHELGERVARAKNVSIEESAQPRRAPRGTSNDLPVPAVLFLFFLLALFLISRMRGGGRGGGYRSGGGGVLPWLILGNMMSGRSGYGGYSGGGFGGYDSGGGGFGGFGGGDSGGGGASSDW